jgi:hypothetical protein
MDQASDAGGFFLTQKTLIEAQPPRTARTGRPGWFLDADPNNDDQAFIGCVHATCNRSSYKARTSAPLAPPNPP